MRLPRSRRPWAAVLAAVPCVLLARPAAAHLPFDIGPGSTSLAVATALPTSHTSWHVFGALLTPGEVDYLGLQLSSGQDLDALLEVFDQPAMAGFAPAFALIGPGLSAPPVGVPFTVPAGDGAMVASPPADPSTRMVDADGPYIWLAGQEMKTTAPQDGQYYLAVWDPQGGTGVYTINWASDDIPDEEVSMHPELAGFKDVVPGDVTGDGKVDVADASVALQIAVGLLVPTPAQVQAGDVAPERIDNAHYPGDGRVGVGDAVRILNFAVGNITASDFP